jgi:hypothetical protein
VKISSTLFLKSIVILIGLIVLALCIFVLPTGISSDRVGYYRPILIGMYLPAMPFFIALYQALKLLELIDTGKAFSVLSVKALKHIKYCALIISALYVVGSPYIYYAAERDDAPGVLAIDLIIVGASIVIAVFAAMLEMLLKNAVAIKSDNDLTV